MVMGCEVREGAGADLGKHARSGLGWPYTGATDGLQGGGVCDVVRSAI